LNKFEKIEKLLGGNNPELIHALAILHVLSKNYEKAIGYFKKTLSLDSNNYLIWNKIGAMNALL